MVEFHRLGSFKQTLFLIFPTRKGGEFFEVPGKKYLVHSVHKVEGNKKIKKFAKPY